MLLPPCLSFVRPAALLPSSLADSAWPPAAIWAQNSPWLFHRAQQSLLPVYHPQLTLSVTLITTAVARAPSRSGLKCFRTSQMDGGGGVYIYIFPFTPQQLLPQGICCCHREGKFFSGSLLWE